MNVTLPIAETPFPTPFPSGLEYAAPARGPWNIVHVGMLLPEAHQIFVCAQGCLRGVVLTAAEMGASKRFSTIAVEERDLLEGDMEALIIEGTADILSRLPKKPPAVLLYTSCVHHFTGCDLDYVYKTLRARFPEVDFTDCYMNPIMRKKTPPDVKMREQLYSLLKPVRQDDGVMLAGTLVPLDETSDLLKLIKKSGRPFRAITDCRSYDDYQQLAKSRLCLTINPAAKSAGEKLEKRLSLQHLYLPLSYDYDEIDENLNQLAAALGLPKPDFSAEREAAEAALARAAAALQGTEVMVDYTATTRPLGLCRLLLSHGIRVTRVYADGFLPAEKPAFDWLCGNAPALEVTATVRPEMGLLPHDAAEKAPGKLLAIGQKAAYFTGTGYFVNLIEGGGHYGYDGIRLLAEEIVSAVQKEKDVSSIIQVKGWGCCG